MNRKRTQKSIGYLISTFSVILLGIVSWSATQENARLRALLIIGMAAAVGGMLLRWSAHKKKDSNK